VPSFRSYPALSVVPGRHDAFLDWHELDHRPENHGRIGHIFHSERFVVPPQGQRDTAAEGPFADPGQYLMIYWSTEEPEKVPTIWPCCTSSSPPGTVRAHQPRLPRDLAASHAPGQGLRQPGPHRLQRGGISRQSHGHRGHRGPLGDDPEWAAWYDRTGVPELLRDGRITAAYTLMPQVTAPDEPFVHLHYLTTADGGIQDAIAEA
jgi:hypothetical protein